MKYHNVPQRSTAWYLARSGHFTGSDFSALMVCPKPPEKVTATQVKLISRVVQEKKTGVPVLCGYASGPMLWGIAQEENACDEYEKSTGNSVVKIGFVELNEWVGVSPDGLIGESGGVEFKCPLPKTHKKYLQNVDFFSHRYMAQVQGAMMVTGREWWDLVSFDPNAEEKLLVVRIPRDENFISRLNASISRAIATAEGYL